MACHSQCLQDSVPTCFYFVMLERFVRNETGMNSPHAEQMSTTLLVRSLDIPPMSPKDALEISVHMPAHPLVANLNV